MYLYLTISPRTVTGPLDTISARTHVEAVCMWAQDTWGFGRLLEITVFPPFFLEISTWGIFSLFAFELET